MSTRAKIASAAASLGVLAIGWSVGTANGQTLGAPTVTTTSTATTQVIAPGTSATSGTGATGTTTGSTRTGSTGTSSTTSAGTATSTSTSTTTTAATASGLKDGTFTGRTASNRYGDVVARITVAGGRITTVAVTTTARDGHSQRINSQAVPLLKSETVAAQSAEISTISGATVTSDSYVTSLQSALDQARA